MDSSRPWRATASPGEAVSMTQVSRGAGHRRARRHECSRCRRRTGRLARMRVRRGARFLGWGDEERNPLQFRLTQVRDTTRPVIARSGVRLSAEDGQRGASIIGDFRSVARAIAGNEPRHRRHRRQPWHFRLCKLQIRLGAGEFESHPLRQTRLRRVWSERVSFRLRATRVPLVALGTNPTLSAK